MQTNIVNSTVTHAASGIVADAYVASLRVTMRGDVVSDSVTMDGTVFEELLGILQARQLAFEPRTRRFRAHSVKAVLIVQRLDRLSAVVAAADDEHPGIAEAAYRLREIAELSDNVSWALA